jgi:hypothetical protein
VGAAIAGDWLLAALLGVGLLGLLLARGDLGPRRLRRRHPDGGDGGGE